jgi:hypothetical protein
MSDLNVQLVREFFELNSFRVMTHWQQDHIKTKTPERGLQLFVENAGMPAATAPGFLLRVNDAAALNRAVVEVRAWHADRMYASHVESNPVLFDVANEESMTLGRNFFGTDDFTTVLVIGELPASPEPRERTLAALRQKNLGHVIEFPTILFELLEKVHPNVSYTSSLTLQMLRLLKRYDFIRYQQLELPFPTEAPVGAAGTPVLAADPELDYAGPDYVMELD